MAFGATSRGVNPCDLGDRRTDQRHPGRLVGRAAVGTGVRNGESVSTSSRSSGHRAAASRTSWAFLNVTTPLKESAGPEVEAPAGLVGPPGEAVDDGALGHALRRQDVEGVVPRLAGVDHQGQAVAVGQLDLGAKASRWAGRGEWS